MWPQQLHDCIEVLDSALRDIGLALARVVWGAKPVLVLRHMGVSAAI